jgi:hypothetical protein
LHCEQSPTSLEGWLSVWNVLVKTEATGIAIGVVIGAAVGAVFDGIATGIVLGLALGIAFAPVIKDRI